MDELREGYEAREREDWTRLAWTCANLMNASGNYKRAVRMQDLLPARFRDAPPSVEDVQRELAEKQKRFEEAFERRRQMKITNGTRSTASGSVQPAAGGLRSKRSKRPNPKKTA